MKLVLMIAGIMTAVFPAPMFGYDLAMSSAVSQMSFIKAPNFVEIVKKRVKKELSVELETVCPFETDPVAKRVFQDYGAVFVSKNGETVPPKCIFDNEEQVKQYQSNLSVQSRVVGGISIKLQKSAMEAFLDAVDEAAQKNIKITPRGTIAAARSYQATVKIWNTRFRNGLDYWVRKEKISRREAELVKKMENRQQVAQVLDWESQGLYFSSNFNKSILYSVAVPGASQHIFLIALDITQFYDVRVRKILAKYGWFQTVKSDLPHFTYLGEKEEKLFEIGLKAYQEGGHIFWIPDIKNNKKLKLSLEK